MSQRKRLEQGRAEFAYQRALVGSKIDKKKEYKSYVKKIPMLIKTNGLGATLAFMKSKGGTYDVIYKDIFEWFKEQKKEMKINFLDLKENEINVDLVAKVISLESPEYRATTIEVLAFLNWLKRFADGLIEGD